MDMYFLYFQVLAPRAQKDVFPLISPQPFCTLLRSHTYHEKMELRLYKWLCPGFKEISLEYNFENVAFL